MLFLIFAALAVYSPHPAYAQMGTPSATDSDAAGGSLRFDYQAEQEFLKLANQARAKAGGPPLAIDNGLTQAARAHAMKMAQQHSLSHQLRGEPPLMERVNASDAHFDSVAENVGLDVSVEGSHQHFLQSRHHRENLLNPAYNLVGFGVVRDGSRLYVTQDFAHGSPAYSQAEAESMVAKQVQNERKKDGYAVLVNTGKPELRSIACSLADQNRIAGPETHALAQHYHVISYMNSSLGSLPKDAAAMLSDPALHSFAVGACFRQNSSTPLGAYWIILLLY